MSVDADRPPSKHHHGADGVWCFEREFEGQGLRPPVRLVVFDWDETLTLSTFLPPDSELRTCIGWCDWAEFITAYNFETPWVSTPGRTRVDKLRALFADLAEDPAGPRRMLAVLTRNSQGVIACLNLLMMADLQHHFGAIWCMAGAVGVPSGVYRLATGDWAPFTPPLSTVFDHKADVLHAICADPVRWFPQLAGDEARLASLRVQEIVLVDDVRTNFQSFGPERRKVLRYCKVSRYDCHYRDMGFKADMGGVGARSDLDYEVLADFVRRPWCYKAALSIQCTESDFQGRGSQPPVDLVVFDFDETLTLHTWPPEEAECLTEVGFCRSAEWRDHFVLYNFQSPYIEGDRVEKLGRMLREVAEDAAAPGDRVARRASAVLTRNEDGAVLVLNLLLLAGLAHHFSAIWSLGADAGRPSGVYRVGEAWAPFELPTASASKCDALRGVVRDPGAWFPQLAKPGPPPEDLRRLPGIALANVVLVDDDRANFRRAEPSADEEAECIVRHCEVARYDDDDFRDQGLVTHLGGIGARSDEDYGRLVDFVRRPWAYPAAACGGAAEEDEDVVARLRSRAATDGEVFMGPQPSLERRHTQEELDSESCDGLARRRALTLPADAGGG